jgi:alpha-pyrone synthase
MERLATGTPPHQIQQSDAAKFVARIPSLEKNGHRIQKLYTNTLIDTRYMAIDLTSEDAVAFHTQRPTVQARMQMYRKHGIPLAETVARKALKDNNIYEGYAPQSESDLDRELVNAIRLIVIVSSTGFIAPGLDAELIKRLKLRRDTARATVSFMGCAAAMNGLRIACDHVRAFPEHKALLVCLELSSINAVFDDNINDIITHSIFGDGCAVAVIGAYPEEEVARHGGIAITKHFSHLVEDTEDGIVLDILDNGITCKLSPQLPRYIENNVGKYIENFLKHQELGKEDIDLWAVHPGGTRIIQKVQDSLGLRDDQVADSWEILRNYGNMLSVAILFVIERMLQYIEINPDDNNGNPLKKKSLTGIAFSFAPGIGIEGILFQKVFPAVESSGGQVLKKNP